MLPYSEKITDPQERNEMKKSLGDKRYDSLRHDGEDSKASR